jgi:predicted glycoside hydrolase/deacetylase ChbG (UPF0249 family)
MRERATPRRVILNADDFGYEPRVTQGIVESIMGGLVRSTTMMVNTPFSAGAARLAAPLSIGLHLNLARGAVLSQPGRTHAEADASSLTAAFVAAETRAQLEGLRALIGREATHVDVHKHLHRHAGVLAGLAEVARERGLPVRSIDGEMRARLRAAGVRTNDVFIGEAGTEPYWTGARWAAQLRALPEEGVVELMCHPGYAPTQLTSGYGAQREVELATLTSEAARSAAERLGLRFASWAEAFG